MKIFVVEDDAGVRAELAALLERYGYSCAGSDRFETIAEDALAAGPDLILVDLNLPYQDGFAVCKKLRARSGVPIIVLTSRVTELDELMSLHIGADDFIAKPYNAQILLARIEKLLKRAYGAGAGVLLNHNGLTLDLLRGTMRHNGQEQELTKNELGILRLLMANKGRVLPRSELINALWQSEAFVDENTLNVNIARLRKKLESLGLPDFLQTRRGLGYQV